MVMVVVHKFGDVKEGFIEETLDIINACYNRVYAFVGNIVDLYLFNKSSTMNAFVSKEKKSLGIKTSAFEASFFAAHDAWHGTPRIMVAYDKALDLPKLVRVGGLNHEVAHTVLHGSLEHYSFPISTSLLKLEEEGIVSRQVLRNLLYLTSIAVKDYEATRLLIENGYIEDQVAYNKYFLEPSEEDYEAWEMVKNNKNVRLILLVSLLKTTCCAAPLLKNERSNKKIAESIVNSMSYLPSELSTRLLKILEVAANFRNNTHENVGLFIEKIIDELVIEDM